MLGVDVRPIIEGDCNLASIRTGRDYSTHWNGSLAVEGVGEGKGGEEDGGQQALESCHAGQLVVEENGNSSNE